MDAGAATTNARGLRQKLRESHHQHPQSSLYVLGVALIIDQVGKGPRLVFRYPLNGGDAAGSSKQGDDLFFKLPARQMAKLFRPKPALCGQPMTLSVGGTVLCCCATLMADADTCTTAVSSSSSPNEQQQAAASDDEAPIGSAGTSKVEQPLALFSVVVALAPKSRTCSIPISGWIDGGGDNNEDSNETQIKQSLSVLEGKLGMPGVYGSRASASFASIQRVHVSLVRICRVLEREERRCKYLSIQSDLFKKIRSDLEKQQINKSANSATPKTSSTTSNSPMSMASKSVAAGGGGGGSERKPRGHRRTSSFSRVGGPGDGHSTSNEIMPSALHRTATGGHHPSGEIPTEELEQEAMEFILASGSAPLSVTTNVTDGGCDSPGSSTGVTTNNYTHYQHGNLAQELAQMYHALARNDHDFPHPSSDLLTGQGGIVYVNNHIAVAIEAVSSHRGKRNSKAKPIIRPYHTLLFPYSSPSQLLDSLKVSGCTGGTGPRRLQQFLLMVSPQKSLKETASDANLPLQAAMEIASYLVGQGACLASPVLSRSSRFACQGIDKIQEESLAFAQTFGPSVNLFVLVSFLTESGRTLSESMQALTTSSGRRAALLREHLESSLLGSATGGAMSQQHLHHPHHHSITPMSILEPTSPSSNVYADPTTSTIGGGPAAVATHQDDLVRRRAEESEELFFKMVTWLRSRLVLNHLLEFLVYSAQGSSITAITGSSVAAVVGRPVMPVLDDTLGQLNNQQRYSYHDRSEKKVDCNALRPDSISDEVLFKELRDLDCLNGKSSLQSCCFRLGLETSRIRGLASRHDQIRIVSRVPVEGDDW